MKRPRRYVIYDQFHWLNPNHLVRVIDGAWNDALEQYRFYKAAFPKESLGLVTEEEFLRKKEALRQC